MDSAEHHVSGQDLAPNGLFLRQRFRNKPHQHDQIAFTPLIHDIGIVLSQPAFGWFPWAGLGNRDESGEEGHRQKPNLPARRQSQRFAHDLARGQAIASLQLEVVPVKLRGEVGQPSAGYFAGARSSAEYSVTVPASLS